MSPAKPRDRERDRAVTHTCDDFARQIAADTQLPAGTRPARSRGVRAPSVLLTLVIASSCHKLPPWQGEVTVTPRERESIAKCGAGALTPAGKQAVTREPYLQQTTTTSTTVVWGSMSPRARVVLTEPGGSEVTASEATYAGDPERREGRERAQRGDPGDIAADDIYVVKAELTGLEPTHLYCYQLFADDVALTDPAPLATAAAPHPTERTRFVAIGDTGTGGAAQRAIAKWVSTQPFDLMLFMGDIAYKSGTPAQLHDYFFTEYRDFLRYVPAYPAIGNHERRTRRGRPYFEAFVLPEPERYYSFDWGNVHFVAIDTTQRDAKQLTWLDEDLRRNKLPWVIVFGHHPMYTNSLRGPQTWIRHAFGKILTDHKVDLVVTGHEHQYERFRVSGVNYVVSGGGGGQLSKFYGTSLALKQFTLHHFLSFDVSATTLTMKVIDIDGRELETLELANKPSGVQIKVDDQPDGRSNAVLPETKTVPDETLYDGPDDDTERERLPPRPGEETVPQKSQPEPPPLPAPPADPAVGTSAR